MVELAIINLALVALMVADEFVLWGNRRAAIRKEQKP
jgi:hypothetical protein